MSGSKPRSGDSNICPKGHDKRIVGRTKRNSCCACNKARHDAWMFTNRASFNERRRQAMAALPKEIRKQVKGWDSERNREKNLRRAYGIGVKEYDAMFEAQDGLCAACGRPETIVQNGTVRRLSVDHDHLVNEVRALLCHNCNRAVGLLRDDPALGYALAAYLKKYQKRNLQEAG